MVIVLRVVVVGNVWGAVLVQSLCLAGQQTRCTTDSAAATMLATAARVENDHYYYYCWQWKYASLSRRLIWWFVVRPMVVVVVSVQMCSFSFSVTAYWKKRAAADAAASHLIGLWCPHCCVVLRWWSQTHIIDLLTEGLLRQKVHTKLSITTTAATKGRSWSRPWLYIFIASARSTFVSISCLQHVPRGLTTATLK